jgi:hypothetical protein
LNFGSRHARNLNLNKPKARSVRMLKISYSIVQHDGGWAYKLGDVFSESFPTHNSALRAARLVALEQQVGDESTEISYQDQDGNWHYEHSDGGDRPDVEIIDGKARAWP